MFGTIWQTPRGLCAGFEISSTAFAPDSSASLTSPLLLLDASLVSEAVNRALGMAPPNAADFAVVLRRAAQARARGDDAGDAHVVEFCGLLAEGGPRWGRALVASAPLPATTPRPAHPAPGSSRVR